ncbi:MAG: hypothetical protein KF799_14030 [Bdellovibrionales bacterium]|nr:hypothetical protein [Bdellovibrionales bacterium]
MNAIKVKFKAGAFPKMLADLSHSNQFLKMFAIGGLALSLVLSILVFVAFARKPVVIAMTTSAEVLSYVDLPNPESEVRQAIRAYIERRYNWTSQSVDQQLEKSRTFVGAAAMKNFLQGTANVKRFSKEKVVTQRAYASNYTVDLKRGSVLVTGDRITEIQGMRAAGALNLELGFQSGPRTAENPWGIYIVKETEK